MATSACARQDQQQVCSYGVSTLFPREHTPLILFSVVVCAVSSHQLLRKGRLTAMFLETAMNLNLTLQRRDHGTFIRVLPCLLLLAVLHACKGADNHVVTLLV
jgi:hypothetical protein